MTNNLGPQPFPPAGGAGFTLGPEQNVFTGATRSAAETARNNYAAANPSWLTSYNDDTTLNIVLEFTSNGNRIAQRQVRTQDGSEWADNGSTIAVKGDPGDAATVANLTARHVPIKSPDAEELIDSGMQARDAGGLYVRDLEVSNESIQLGPELRIGDNVSTIGLTRESDGSSYIVGSTQITDDGFDRNTRPRPKNLEVVDLNSTTDANSPISTQVHEITYAAVQSSFVDYVELESEGEIENLNISIIKVVNGQDKVIYPFTPPVSYNEGNGIYVVNSLPPNPDPRRTYVIRDGATGRFRLNVDHASFAEEFDTTTNTPFFKLKFETTDSTLGLKSRTFEPTPGLGDQKVPVLTVAQHDYDNLPTADLRDVYRRYRVVDQDVTLSSANDFDRDFNARLKFVANATFTFGTSPFPWLEGASIEVEGDGGAGTISINGFTIGNSSTFTIADGSKAILTFEDDENSDFSVSYVDKGDSIKSTENINNAIRFTMSDGSQEVETTSPYTRPYVNLGQGATPGTTISLTNFRAAWMELHPDAAVAAAINFTSDLDNDIVFAIDGSQLTEDVVLTIVQANSVWNGGSTTVTLKRNHVLQAFVHRQIGTVPPTPANPNTIYFTQSAVDGAIPVFHPEFENTIVVSQNGDDTLNGETFPEAVETVSRARQLLSGISFYKQVYCPDASSFNESSAVVLSAGEDLNMPYAEYTGDISGPQSGHCRVELYKHFGLCGVGTQDQFIIREQSGNVQIQGVSHDNTKIVIDDFQSGQISFIDPGNTTGVIYLDINKVHGTFALPSIPSGVSIIGRIEDQYLGLPSDVIESGANNLYVALDAAPDGDGTRSFPFNSLQSGLDACAAIPSGQHKKLNSLGVESLGSLTNTSTTNNIANFIINAEDSVFSSITLADHATTVSARVCSGDIQLADQCTVELRSLINNASGSVTFTAEQHNTTKLSARRMESTVSINFAGILANSHITIQIDEFDGTDTQIQGMLNTIPSGVNVSGWIGNRNLSTNYLKNIITYSDTSTQAPSGTDSPMVIAFGAGGSDSDSLVTMSSTGVLTINKGGPFAFPMRAHVSRGGSLGDAELFVQMEKSTDSGVNWTAISTTSFVNVEDSSESLEFFGFQAVILNSSDQIRFRFARSSNGINDGSLTPVTPPSALVTAGFSTVPSAVLAVYSQSNYPYR